MLARCYINAPPRPSSSSSLLFSILLDKTHGRSSGHGRLASSDVQGVGAGAAFSGVPPGLTSLRRGRLGKPRLNV